jgi:hypothetical protein
MMGLYKPAHGFSSHLITLGLHAGPLEVENRFMAEPVWFPVFPKAVLQVIFDAVLDDTCTFDEMVNIALVCKLWKRMMRLNPKAQEKAHLHFRSLHSVDFVVYSMVGGNRDDNLLSNFLGGGRLFDPFERSGLFFVPSKRHHPSLFSTPPTFDAAMLLYQGKNSKDLTWTALLQLHRLNSRGDNPICLVLHAADQKVGEVWDAEIERLAEENRYFMCFKVNLHTHEGLEELWDSFAQLIREYRAEYSSSSPGSCGLQ